MGREDLTPGEGLGLRGARDDAIERTVERALGFDDIVIDLKPEEKSFRHAEIACEPQVKACVHSTIASDHCLNLIARDIKRMGKRLRIKAERLHEFKDQQFSRMAVVQPVRISGSQ